MVQKIGLDVFKKKANEISLIKVTTIKISAEELEKKLKKIINDKYDDFVSR